MVSYKISAVLDKISVVLDKISIVLDKRSSSDKMRRVLDKYCFWFALGRMKDISTQSQHFEFVRLVIKYMYNKYRLRLLLLCLR